jgi:hypothetical protein
VPYPLEVAGPDDYALKVGSMLLTLVDPNKGFEAAYNRWYERDHYYGGCMIGPWLYAGSRWVATRALKDLRWPQEDTEASVARPYDSGSYVAIYFVEKGHHDEHFADWARPQVNRLYRDGRGFPERKHTHTVLYDFIGAAYRDPDPVPAPLALDARYDGIVAVWMDDAGGRPAAELHADLAASEVPALLKDSPIEIAMSWTPSAGENDPKEVPMDLGSKAGGPERLCQLFFVRGDVTAALPGLHAYTDAVAEVATLRLAAPFVATVVGTDTYVDQLW